MRLHAFAITLSALILSSAAIAADMPVKAVAPPAPVDPGWTGFYIGLNGGWGWGKSKYEAGNGSANAFLTIGQVEYLVPGNTFGGLPGTEASHNINGGLFGGHFGYNVQVGSFVVGFEASVAWSDIRGSTGDVDLATLLIAPGVTYRSEGFMTSKLNWLATATPRIGIAPSSSWMIYVKGGLAAGQMDFHAERTGSGPNAGSFWDDRLQRVGYTVGGGLEFALTRNWIFGVEANYVNLGRQHSGGNFAAASGGLGILAANEFIRLDFVDVLGRVSYKFDWSIPGARF